MMSSFLIGVVYLLAALYMIIQQFRIAGATSDDDQHWAETVSLYKNQLRRVRLVGTLLLMVLCVVVTLLLVPADFAQSFALIWIKLPYERQSIPLMLAAAFMAALFSDWIDHAFEVEAVDNSENPSSSRIRQAWQDAQLQIGKSPRRWLYWFLISLLLGVASDAAFHRDPPDLVRWVNTHFPDETQPTAFPNMMASTQKSPAATTSAPSPITIATSAPSPATTATSAPPLVENREKTEYSDAAPWHASPLSRSVASFLFVRAPAVVIACSFTGALWLSYRAWVRTHIRRKMTDEHKFGPTIVPTFMKDFDQRDIPSQVIIIGPKYSGKSRAFQSCDGRYVRQSIKPMFASYMQLMPDKARKLISIGDMPGENLGDHIYFVRTYRTNRLVLTISAGAFNAPSEDFTQDPLCDLRSFTLDNVSHLFDPDARNNDGEQVGTVTKEYFSALKLVLLRHTTPGQAMVKEYDVRSLTLVLNVDNRDPRQMSVAARISREGLSRLASEIGSKLGIAVWYYIDVYITSVYHSAVLKKLFAADCLANDNAAGLDEMILQFGGKDEKMPRVFYV